LRKSKENTLNYVLPHSDGKFTALEAESLSTKLDEGGDQKRLQVQYRAIKYCNFIVARQYMNNVSLSRC